MSEPLNPQVRIGHVHLKVSDLDRSVGKDLLLSQGARRARSARYALLSYTGREAHARGRAKGLHARPQKGTTHRGKGASGAEDLVKRNFVATVRRGA